MEPWASGWRSDVYRRRAGCSWVFGGVALFSLLLTWPSMVPVRGPAHRVHDADGLGNGAVFELVPEISRRTPAR